MKPRIRFSPFHGKFICYGQVNGLTLSELGDTVGEALARWNNSVRFTFAP